LSVRGVLSGAVLAFARALGEFGATILFAGNIPGQTQTISLSIYHSVQLGQEERAMRLLLVSVLIAFAAVWTSEFYLQRRRAAR
jgi:molybdate transport system permease protein